jgi:hypothetical protein
MMHHCGERSQWQKRCNKKTDGKAYTDLWVQCRKFIEDSHRGRSLVVKETGRSGFPTVFSVTNLEILAIAANFHHFAILEKNFNLHFFDQVISSLQIEKAFNLPLIYLLV